MLQVDGASGTGNARLLNGPEVQIAPFEGGGGAINADRFTYEIPERRAYPCILGCVRRWLFNSFVSVVFVGSAIVLTALVIKNNFCKADERATCVDLMKLFSVPLVCLLFTWFHVWLALQMMFYPIKFYGCPGRPIVPDWLGLPINGWQGVVPRKAHLMAERVCDTMIGNIVTIEEFMDRVDADHFHETLSDSFGKISSDVLDKLATSRWPDFWASLPDEVKVELKTKVSEDTRSSFLPALNEIKLNINTILDLRQMSSDALSGNPALLVWMFKQTAQRELVFITHVAAVMGFLLGMVQVVLYIVLKNIKGFDWDYVMLPVSGLIIGYFTNWLAIKMTFYPVWPHMYCNNTVNIQGVFMKRQREASDQLARLVCSKVVDAKAMLTYLVESPNSSKGVEKVLEIYKKHISNTVDKNLGRLGIMVPSFVREGVESMKEDLVKISLEVVPEHTDRITKYMDDTMKIEETLSYRLARITPVEFERIIHPMFEEDEWILLVVGGFLGRHLVDSLASSSFDDPPGASSL
jgi:uncharacterized membrane protein YheB (UPF0754 family)